MKSIVSRVKRSHRFITAISSSLMILSLIFIQSETIFSGTNDLRGIPAPYNFGNTQKLLNKDLFSAGGGGDFGYLTWDGEDFRTTISESLDITALYFVSPNNGWVVGGDREADLYGRIYHTNNKGHSWVLKKAVDNGLYGVYCINDSKCWVVGSEGTIYFTENGEYWKSQTSGIKDSLYSVYFLDENIGWSVGNYGTILKTNDGGKNWREIKLQYRNSITKEKYSHFKSVKFFNKSLGWIAGLDGVLRTEDGGETWENPNTDAAEGIVTQDGKTVYSITDNGRNYISCESGKTWKLFQVKTTKECNY